jgi:Mg-chelatase subunit ChlD
MGMLARQRLTTYGIATTAIATLALAAWLRPWKSGSLVDQVPRATPTDSHQIDVVFAVDTTGSMGPLIDGAKRTVWSIASHIHEIDPQANVRIGLVAYRDVRDAYVTKDFALTSDLDSVFTELSSYRAEGGDDFPEDVDAGLYDAVHKMQWRDGAKKMIFLVGDAPPASRHEVPTFDVTAKVAAERQITINTIRCGTDATTAQTWQEIAMLAKGEFSTIQQDGGVQQIATPYDAKVAELSRKIDNTTIVYGDSAVHARYEAKMAATEGAPAPAAADRGAYYATAKPGASREDADLIGGIANGKMSLDAIDQKNLPAGMQGMSKDQLKAEVAKRAEERMQAQKELADLAKQRNEYLKKSAKGGAGGFDDKVKATLEHELK